MLGFLITAITLWHVAVGIVVAMLWRKCEDLQHDVSDLTEENVILRKRQIEQRDSINKLTAVHYVNKAKGTDESV